MALIRCTECGKEFSMEAGSCPNCACPTSIVKQKTYEQAIKQFEEIDNTNDIKNLYRLLSVFESLSNYKTVEKEIKTIKNKINLLSVEKNEENKKKKSNYIKIFTGVGIFILVIILLVTIPKLFNSVVGRWENNCGLEQLSCKIGKTYSLTFNSDKSGEYDAADKKTKFTWTTEGNKLKIKYEGRDSAREFDYKLEGDELQLIDIDGFNGEYSFKRK